LLGETAENNEKVTHGTWAVHRNFKALGTEYEALMGMLLS